MSYTYLRHSEPKSRKEYGCDACEYLRREGEPKEIDFNPTEWEAIQRAKANNWRINKGEKYYNQVGTYDGDIGAFRAIPEIHEICKTYNFYEYD